MIDNRTELPSFKIGRKLKESDIELLIENSIEEILDTNLGYKGRV